MRVCGYLRTALSGEGDGVDGSPLEEQKRQVAELSAAQGYPVQAWFIDEGFDGDTLLEERPSGCAMVERVKEGVYHAVAVLGLDRLGRVESVVDGALQAISDAGGHVRVLTT